MKQLKILIACEFSGIVREAFRSKGYNAWSCDLLPSEIPGHHFQCDVRDILNDGWNMMIAFPPCTHLAVSGAHWFKYKEKEQQEALSFVTYLMGANIQKIAIENPIGIISTRIRKPDQIIQPYQFGEPYSKATCLWLKNLPKLQPTEVLENYDKLYFRDKIFPGKDRGKNRSRTLPGIANAMSEQWGSILVQDKQNFNIIYKWRSKK